MPGKRPTPPVITTAQPTLRSLKELLNAQAATVSPPSEWPRAPTHAGSVTWGGTAGDRLARVGHRVEHEREVRQLVDDVAAIPVAPLARVREGRGRHDLAGRGDPVEDALIVCGRESTAAGHSTSGNAPRAGSLPAWSGSPWAGNG
jgi:hypothetical protein